MNATAILDRVLDPVGECLTPAVARKLVKLRADPKLQAEMADLASKCNEGHLTAEELTRYETYVRAIHFITVLQSQARRLLAGQS